MADIFVQKQAMDARLSCTTTPIWSVNTWSGRSGMNASWLAGNKRRQNTPGGWTDRVGAIHWVEISFRGACTCFVVPNVCLFWLPNPMILVT